jgi:K+-transporting ATPase ATPase C chain
MKEHVVPSLRLFLALTLLLGFAYPAAVWGVGRLAFRDAADGSFLRKGETTVGSSLIGQSFTSPLHFHGRPSAAGEKGYDATASGGTNLGPTSKKLAEAVRDAVALMREENLAASGAVPADAVTSSGSGLDPHVSPEYARWQAPRVAAATGIPTADLEKMIAARTEGRFFGLFGEPRVNVLLLNLDLTERFESVARAR